MRIWGAEGYVSLDFAAREATLVRPSEQLRRGRLDLEGLDLTQPAAIKEHVFGKILRVDQVSLRGPRAAGPGARGLRRGGAGRVAPRVGGEDGLRAMRLADQVLRSLESHRWEGTGSSAPPPSESGSALQGPHAWRIKNLKHAPNLDTSR